MKVSNTIKGEREFSDSAKIIRSTENISKHERISLTTSHVPEPNNNQLLERTEKTDEDGHLPL